MTNTTQTYWSVDGESLQTFAFNISLLGGDRDAPPALRGSDINVPYLPGSVWTPRTPESRTITLGMWVAGANEDGTIPISENLRRTYDRNWKHLRRLLWTPRRQFTLTKRFWVETAELEAGGVNTTSLPKDGLWSLYTATAKASYAGGLNPQMTGPARATFTVDLLLSDPFFYGPTVEFLFSTATGGSNPGPNRTVTILGDDLSTQVEVEFLGPLTSPRMTNSTEGALWLQYSTVVPVGERAVAYVKDFKATHFPTGAPFKSSGYVSHDGDHFWLYLDKGTTTLMLTTQAGTGTAKVRYQPSWL